MLVSVLRFKQSDLYRALSKEVPDEVVLMPRSALEQIRA